MRLLFSVMMPLAKPMLGTIGIIGALAMWNELPFTLLFLHKPELRTLIQSIALMQGEFGLTVPTMSAAVLVSAFVPLALFAIFQKHVTMGATAGSVKG
jgi:ABC-type glycerol-3-phosphate transport system permease component